MDTEDVAVMITREEYFILRSDPNNYYMVHEKNARQGVVGKLYGLNLVICEKGEDEK